MDGEVRYPALDGLRGIAVIAVVFTHLFPPDIPEGQWWLWPFALASKIGWTGVDLFFVLSGFLITGVLIAHRSAPNYFAAFYWRRALRILPLYYLLLLGETIYSGPTAPMWPYWLFLSNFNVLMTMHWSLAIAVTWTLSIEEQFYLTWPLAVRFLSNRWAALLALSLLLLSLGIRLVLLIEPPQKPPGIIGSIFVITITHIDGLAVGALVGVVYHSEGGRLWLDRFAGTWWLWLAALALVLTVGQVNGWPELPHHVQIWMARVGFTLIALLYASIMLLGLLRDGLVRRVCDSPGLMRVGDYSYCIYLFHRPIGALVKEGLLRLFGDIGVLLVFVVSCIAIFFVGHISYVTIEAQARKRKSRISYWNLTERSRDVAMPPSHLGS